MEKFEFMIKNVSVSSSFETIDHLNQASIRDPLFIEISTGALLLGLSFFCVNR